ncbi:Alpha/Beta hydrolase protein [Hypoxylon crocopeplum]|nr:Alpha/Beta hydrolase protein [Hypoxylon crocopeplum]
MSLITSSPGKYVWVIGAILINLVKLPLLLLYYQPKFTRPHHEWTIRQSVLNHVMNSFLFHTAYVEAVTPLDLRPGSFRDRFVPIPVGPNSLYTGVLKADPAIAPCPTGAIWYPETPARARADEDKPVILHFHPGGYAMGDVRSDGTFAARLLTDRVRSQALLSLYRLASNQNGRFPAALQDGLSAYHYLLTELSIPASQIVLSGDSAGGHIVICMLRYLTEHSSEIGLPAPKAALLWSPAINLMASVDPSTITESRNYAKDYLDPTFITWGARRFVSNVPGCSAYMNPLDAAFKSPCPIWAFCGGNEVFHDEIAGWVQQMKAVPENEVALRVERLANHDIFFAGNLTGWKAEAEDAADDARRWLERLLQRRAYKEL